jgi:hypothetical protein
MSPTMPAGIIFRMDFKISLKSLLCVEVPFLASLFFNPEAKPKRGLGFLVPQSCEERI